MEEIPSNQAFRIDESGNPDDVPATSFSTTDSDPLEYRFSTATSNWEPSVTTESGSSRAAHIASRQLRRDLPLSPSKESLSTTESDTSDYHENAVASMAASSIIDTTPKAQHRSQFPSMRVPEIFASPVASSAPMRPPSRPTQTLTTKDAYDQWSSVYDTDGNILQAIDDLEMQTLLPSLLELVSSEIQDSLSVLDVGCGTGRNTAKLLQYQHSTTIPVHVTGLDLSQGMLLIAETKLRPLVTQPRSLKLLQFDPFAVTDTTTNVLTNRPPISPAHALISTLVMEHVQLVPYFRALASMLRPGGYALITNMHPEMGFQSQAGFVAADGTKVRGQSWAHGLQETVRVAEQENLELLGEVREKTVDESMVGREVSERGRKWIGVKVWCGFLFRRKV